MAELDVVVVGAGVVGLAVAAALAQHGRDVVVLEAEARPGEHTSSRNSEVIHAGIYDPPSSLKARTCLRGRELLYRYCEAQGIPHRKVGKFIVAVDETERSALDTLLHTARDNGATEVRPASRAELSRHEPEVTAAAALWSPSTGIVDSHALLRSLQADAQRAGATFAWRTTLDRVDVDPDGFRLHTTGEAVTCRALVNAAGLHATSVARRIDALAPARVPEVSYVKGHYFHLRGPSPFEHLVYPVPPAGGLGIHVTLDLAGAARFGPDHHPTTRIDYDVDPGLRDAFVAAIRRYWPNVPPDRLQPGYAGIRPRIADPSGRPTDFVVSGPSEHEIAGLVNLFGIESPGLTAALALAEQVRAHLG